MDWVLDNLESVIVPIIILILYGLGNAAKGKKKKSSGKRAAGPEKAKSTEVRRVRDIQDEIRRKIAERTGRVTDPPSPESKPHSAWEPQEPKTIPFPSRHKMPQKTRELSQYPLPKATKPVPTKARTVPVFDTEFHQRDIEEKERQVQALEAVIKRRARSGRTRQARPVIVAKESLRSQLFHDLAHPLGQRKAILLSEILGQPLGLKGPANRGAKW